MSYKTRLEGHVPNDTKGSINYKTAAMDRHDYAEKGRRIYPKTINHSSKDNRTTSVRFGGGQDKKVVELVNKRSRAGLEYKMYKEKSDPFYKGKSPHVLDLRKKAMDKKKK